MKQTFILIVIFLLCYSLHAQNNNLKTQDCDCKYPYRPDPPCWDTCISRLSRNVSYNKLVNDYNIPDTIAKKVQIWSLKKDSNSLKDILSVKELGKLQMAIQINKEDIKSQIQ